MIARVLDGEKEFCSYVFAQFIDGFKSTVIVFDGANNRYKKVQMYDTKPYIVRKVFIVDCDRAEWISPQKNFEGYAWLVNDPSLIKDIELGKPVAEEYVSRAVALNKTIVVNEWTEVTTDNGAENLLTAAWDFHDSTIKSIGYDKDKLTVVFEGCWNSTVVLEFEGDIALHYVDNDMNPVFGSSIIFDGSHVFWVDEHIKGIEGITDDLIVFRGRKLRWKQVLKANKS